MKMYLNLIGNKKDKELSFPLPLSSGIALFVIAPSSGDDAGKSKFATTAADGKTYLVENYNLDVIISVGYRVKSKRGTQFRQWATQRLKDHLVKGYTLNEKRLNQVLQNMRILSEVRFI